MVAAIRPGLPWVEAIVVVISHTSWKSDWIADPETRQACELPPIVFIPPSMPSTRFEPSSIKNKTKRQEIVRKLKRERGQRKLQSRLAIAKAEIADPAAKKVRLSLSCSPGNWLNYLTSETAGTECPKDP